MDIRAILKDALDGASEAIGSLKAIERWDMSTVFGNVGIIVEAVEDGFAVLLGVKDMATDLVNDEEAQEALAEYLDEIIKLNAVLEAVDGMIFKVIIKAICATLSPMMEPVEVE